MKQLWWASLLLIGTLFTACGGNETRETVRSKLDLPLPTLAGEEGNLSDYAGKVIIVNFWATWCAPCRTEMPLLEAYYQAYKDDGLVLLAVNDRESANRVQGYIDEGGYSFPVVLDVEGLIADFFGGLRAMPTTFVLDQQGEVVYQHVGLLDGGVLDREVTSLLQ